MWQREESRQAEFVPIEVSQEEARACVLCELITYLDW